jgi:hypothetical protein
VADPIAEIRVHRYVRTRRLPAFNLDEAIEKARAAFAELGNLADTIEVRITAETQPPNGTFGYRQTWWLDIDANIDDRPEPNRG